ncbi:hypothetical protein Pmar_PMAR028690 [Perkinsus marinus ATCC 50983]|uniref:Uncharacterized protein n=1 Tax=Perkinsus marinus (strain ATCC 50983 / TXsc) TaxID=423536 RepID=C5K8L7_PERM5|nr:hypothetical protein Pmar_PMAR028690 [Perkinsus marinus ATCC 50983]EER19224.1 hypothetical protein Pmar_PMAR028690 [Perkinsus marinus ATCC 50983]|eukprot:XP_002787428.1 hypothetical protein Pmar_PMAR028690 [Perkinsus marinus ATCC 50983]
MTYSSLTTPGDDDYDDSRYQEAREFLYEASKLMRESTAQTDLLSYQNAFIHDKVGPLVRTSFGVGVLMGVRPDGTAEVQLQTLKMYPRLTDIRLLPERCARPLPSSYPYDEAAPSQGLKREAQCYEEHPCPNNNKRQLVDYH